MAHTKKSCQFSLQRRRASFSNSFRNPDMFKRRLSDASCSILACFIGFPLRSSLLTLPHIFGHHLSECEKHTIVQRYGASLTFLSRMITTDYTLKNHDGLCLVLTGQGINSKCNQNVFTVQTVGKDREERNFSSKRDGVYSSANATGDYQNGYVIRLGPVLVIFGVIIICFGQ